MKVTFTLMLVATALVHTATALTEWKMVCALGEFAVCSGYCQCNPEGGVICPSINIPGNPLTNAVCCNAAKSGCVTNANCGCYAIDPPCGHPSRCKLTTEGKDSLWVDTKTGEKYCRHFETGAAAGTYTGNCRRYLDGENHTEY